MHTQVLTLTRHRRARWATATAVTMALAVGPALLVAAPASALPLSVTAPAEGSTSDSPFVVFTGTGTAGNTITISYPGAGGITEAGADDVLVDETFDILAGFGELPPGATTVAATVTETSPGTGDGTPGPVVGVPIVRTINFAVAPNPAIPFVVTFPGQGDTVTTSTPTFTGTGTPGETVTIEYTNASGEDAVAGTGVIALDGSFSIPTSFTDLTPGALEVRTISSATGADGTPSDQVNVFTNFFFAVAPVPPFVPNPPAIDVVPATITVADSTRADRGLAITATGFAQNEELTLALAGPTGPIELAFSDTGYFSDATGSYADSLVLTGTPPTGTYTLTITGVNSELALSDTFTVVADPLPAGSGGGGELAATGSGDKFTQGLLALAVLMTLAGTVLVVRRRQSFETAS